MVTRLLGPVTASPTTAPPPHPAHALRRHKHKKATLQRPQVVDANPCGAVASGNTQTTVTAKQAVHHISAGRLPRSSRRARAATRDSNTRAGRRIPGTTSLATRYAPRRSTHSRRLHTSAAPRGGGLSYLDEASGPGQGDDDLLMACGCCLLTSASCLLAVTTTHPLMSGLVLDCLH